MGSGVAQGHQLLYAPRTTPTAMFLCYSLIMKVKKKSCHLTRSHFPGHSDWLGAGHLTQAGPIIVPHPSSVHSDWLRAGYLTLAGPIMVLHSSSVCRDWF